MITGRLETIFIGGIANQEFFTFRRNEFIRTSYSSGITSFLLLDAIAGFESIGVVALSIGGIIFKAQNLSILIDVIGIGESQQGGQDELERKID